MVRNDVYEEWGWPDVVADQMPKLLLDDVLLDARDAQLRMLWLNEEKHEIHWNGKENDKDLEGLADGPVVVAEVGDGGWGKRVHKWMLPATKASAWGIDGRTHLVAQQKDGKWCARTLHKVEVQRIFESERVKLQLADDDDEAIGEMGNAGPARMVQPHADGLAQWCRPPSDFVPQSIDEIVPKEAVLAIRGTMMHLERDFKRKVKKK